MHEPEQNRRLVLAITGASGAVYAVRLLDVLLAAGCDVYLSISPAGQAVLKEELGLTVDLDDFDPASLRSPEWSEAAENGNRPRGRQNPLLPLSESDGPDCQRVVFDKRNGCVPLLRQHARID